MNYKEIKEEQFKLLYGGGQNWGKVNKAQFYNQLQQEIFAKKYKKPKPQKVEKAPQKAEKAMEKIFYGLDMFAQQALAGWWKDYEIDAFEWRSQFLRKEVKPIEDWE